MTNSGAGCRVHFGGIELADGCRTRVGRLCGMEVATWTEDERAGAGTLFLGGMAGGGPLTVPVVEDWDWTLGGNCGSLSFAWSDEHTDLDVMLEVLCRIAEVAFDIDWAIVFCGAFTGGWTIEIFEIDFCASMGIVWDVTCVWLDFTEILLEVCRTGCIFVSIAKL